MTWGLCKAIKIALVRLWLLRKQTLRSSLLYLPCLHVCMCMCVYEFMHPSLVFLPLWFYFPFLILYLPFIVNTIKPNIYYLLHGKNSFTFPVVKRNIFYLFISPTLNGKQPQNWNTSDLCGSWLTLSCVLVVLDRKKISSPEISIKERMESWYDLKGKKPPQI